MEEINTVTLYPAWKQAVEIFIASGFDEGDVVPHDWFWENLQIEKPEEDTPLKQAEKLKLEFISQFEALRAALLMVHNVDLKSVRSVGYKIVPARQQAEVAEEDMQIEINKILKKTVRRINFTDMNKLNQEDKAKHMNTYSRVTNLKSMIEYENKKAIESNKMLTE